MKKKWYAILTKPRWEKKVAALLDKNNISNYCPLNRVVRQWSDRKKVVSEPLFKSYVFVQVSDLEQVVVRRIDGVINFVYWLGKPAVIRDDEIETIQRFLMDYTSVQVEKVDVNVNDMVRIVNGPLTKQEGVVILTTNNKVKVVLPTLGYAMIAEIRKSDVELIKSKENKNKKII